MLARKIWILTQCVMIATVFAGCSGTGNEAKDGGAQGKEKSAQQEPVTLNFYFNTVMDDFDKYINQFIKKKFPFVTINMIEKTKGRELDKLIAAGEIPDIVWEGLTNIRGSLELNAPMDLTALAKKNQFDFNKYDPTIVDSIKSYSEHGEIYYLPFNVFVFATQYNKDIFDKFGVPYLKDNMTWDEMIESAKRLNRTVDGSQYRGIQISNINRTQTQLSLSYVDKKTEKASLQTDGWKRMLDLWKTVNDMSGAPKLTSFGSGRDDFYKKRTLAIFPDILMLQNTDMVTAEKEGLKWDIVTFPTFKDKPGIGPGVFSDGFFIPNGSKHADLAFQIISYLSTDPEVQMAASQNGRITGLKDPEIRKHAFENNPAAKGKNLTNIYKVGFAPPHESTTYDRSASTIVSKKVVEYITGSVDANTILREADEELNKSIQSLKKQ